MFESGFGLEVSVCRTLGKLIGMFHFPPDGYNQSIISTSSRGLELQREGGERDVARKKRKCFTIQCLKPPRLHTDLGSAVKRKEERQRSAENNRRANSPLELHG